MKNLINSICVMLSLMFITSLDSCKKDDTNSNANTPVANFIVSGDNNFAPRKVSFTNTSTDATSYNWDFGDGQYSNDQSPSHVFTNGGNYNVTLTASNSTGKQSVINKTIIVKNIPTKFTINSITLTGFPSTKPDGAGWDVGSAPDLYFQFTDDSKTDYFTSGYYSDVLQSDLPLTYSTDAGFPRFITSLDFKYIINLLDNDSPLSPDLLGGFYFTVRNYMPTNGDLYPTTISVQNPATTQIKFTINVSWGY